MALTVTLADGGTATLTGTYKRWVKATITASSGSDFGAYSFWADSKYSSTYNQQYLYPEADSSLKYVLTFQISSYGTFVKYFWLQYAGETSYDIQLRNSSGTAIFTENYTKGISGGGGGGGGQTPVSYTIIYKSNPPSGQTELQTSDTANGYPNATTFTPLDVDHPFSNIDKTYYYLDYWSTSSNGGTIYKRGISYPISSKLILYAQWGVYIYHTATFDKNAPDASSGTTTVDVGPFKNSGESGYVYASQVTAPTRSGYTFEGWSTSSNATYSNVGFPIKVSKDITFYAVWEKEVSRTITYYKNDIENTYSEKSYKGPKSGIPITIPTPAAVFTNPAYPGRTFSHWNTDKNDDGTSYFAGNPYSLKNNQSWYAMWTFLTAVQPSSLKITGKTASSITVSWTVNASYGTTYAILDNDPSGEKTVSSSGSTYSHTFSGLTANKAYTIYVYHKNNTIKSNNISATTNIASFYWVSNTNDEDYITQKQPVTNITATKWDALQAKISEVSVRLGKGEVSYNSIEKLTPKPEMIAEGGNGQDYGFNNVRKKLETLGCTGLPDEVSSGDPVLASYFMAFKTAINNAIATANQK